MAVFGRDIMALLKGDKGDDGSALQIRVSDGYIQWKLETDTDWNNIIAEDELKGADGSPVELRLYSGWIEWKLQSEDYTQWKNLVAVSTLQGEDGEDGKDGLSVKTAELSSGVQVPSAAAFDAITVGTTGEINPTNISDFVVGDIIVIHCTISGMSNGNAVMLGEVTGVGSSNITYSVVAAIRNGEDGNALQIRVSDGYIQWKLETDTDWNNVIAVDELKGDDGATPTMNQLGMWFINGESTGVSGRGTRMVVAETESPVTMTKAEFEALVVGKSYSVAVTNDFNNNDINSIQTGDLIFIPTTISDMSGGGAFQIGIVGGITSGGEKRSYTLVSAIMVEDGEDGSALEIRVSDGYIQWKLATQTAWKNVIAVDELKGADGVTPHISEDGYWYLGDTSTGVKAQGTNGTDGVGVPAGGTAGQVLKKKSNTDYDTEWSDEEGGGGAATEVTKSAIANALGCTETQLDTLVALAQQIDKVWTYSVSGIPGSDAEIVFKSGTAISASYFNARYIPEG